MLAFLPVGSFVVAGGRLSGAVTYVRTVKDFYTVVV